MGQGQQVVHLHDFMDHIKITLDFLLQQLITRLIISSSNSFKVAFISPIRFIIHSSNSNGFTIELWSISMYCQISSLPNVVGLSVIFNNFVVLYIFFNVDFFQLHHLNCNPLHLHLLLVLCICMKGQSYIPLP